MTVVAPAPSAELTGRMSHREVLEALSGLLLAMFVAMVSSTIVSNALPRIITELHGTQSGYTWVVVATLLTMTASTPIWGKLADQFNKKLLVQTALTIFLVGSLIAGFAQSMGMLIFARAIQGLGVGGLSALVQVVIAVMVTPRERGRYSGYIGAVFALATVSGPLIGGFLVDAPGLGWRWCFWVGVPIAVVAFSVLQKTLHLPVVRRPVQIDFLGATVLTAGVSLLLVWVSLAGNQFDWVSTISAVLVAGGVLLLVAAVYVEMRVAAEPVIPMRLFRDRTTSLATLASVFVGIAMFGATVYLQQYFQLARGMSPTKAGLMSVCMVGGLLISSILSGRIITRTGVWKRWLVGGMVLVVVGLVLLGQIDETTSLTLVGIYMFILGVGLGATMQNLVLAVQNNTRAADMGAASSVVSFFRSMGGSIGVSALGAVLSAQVAAKVSAGLERLAQTHPEYLRGLSHDSHAIPDLASLPVPVRMVFEHAFGAASGHLFLIAAPFAFIALVAVLFIREVPLRTTMDDPGTPARTATPTTDGDADGRREG
ncbi:MAG TPA: MDR family MFS transporter [Marmoricola sp.]|nr:MDR family MFS transporter [Marmoricola sp.]